MLKGLDIRDILIIERLELEFQPGLNVLTGETGAGKSILLDSLGFVLGWRGRAELVRTGADQGEVTAVFELSADHPARRILQDAGLPGGTDLILRRVNSADGRKTAWANDRRVSGEVLRQLSETLVELHGQHDDKGLLNPRSHRLLLDEFSNLSKDIKVTRKAWRTLSVAKATLAKAKAALAAVQEEEDFLRHAVGELDQLDPQPGEEAALDARRRLMQAAGRISDDIEKARQSIGTGGAEGLVTDATRWLEDVSEKAQGRLDAPLSALLRAMNELGVAQQGIEDCLSAMSFNPSELEEAEERLFAIRELARKYDVQPDELGGHAEQLRQKLAALDGGAAEIDSLKKAVQTSEISYEKAADVLTERRERSARSLDKSMALELAPLKMERAEFTTEVIRCDPGPDGKDAVAFTVATNPGAPAGALNRIASGGELSRFLLALKVCLTKGMSGLTLIFDEIDRGVGGATADAVGRRLSALARDSQVLVVTHSPQVAARGQYHWRVEKRVEKMVSGDITISTVTPLPDDARVDEIARMLAGDTVTDQARDAARALLSG